MLVSLRSLVSKLPSSSSTNNKLNKLKGKRSSMAARGWRLNYDVMKKGKGRPPFLNLKLYFFFSWLVNTVLLFLQMHFFWTKCIHTVKIGGCQLGWFIYPQTPSNWGSCHLHLITGLGHPFLQLARSYHIRDPFFVHPARILGKATFLKKWQISNWLLSDFITGMSSRKGNLRVDYKNSLFL